MSERVPCSNPDCRNTILPATAASNGGLCAPCIGAIRKREHDEFVRQNRRTINQYEGITDLVEMAVIMLSPRKYDPLIVYASPPISSEELFASLTVEQQNRLAGIAKNALQEGKTDLAEDIAKSLATLTNCDLTEMLRTWVDRDHCWPAIAFRAAKPKIRDRVIKSVLMGRANANHALCALAWIGDDVVQKTFAEWDVQKPAWAAKLHLSPSGYSDIAGWELVNNKRRNLFHESCFALMQTDEGKGVASVKTFQPVNKSCPWCEQRLSHMLDIDLADTAFNFLEFDGSRLPILTCHGCTCYGGAFYSKIEPDGNAIPHPHGVRPKWLPANSEQWADPAWRNIPVALSSRSAIHAADWCMDLKSSQIGGMPCWIQDAEYPKCPDCSNTMKFIAQLNEDDFPGCEGTYYAFLCTPCRTTATSYQQT